jgi:hypothetical protein
VAVLRERTYETFQEKQRRAMALCLAIGFFLGSVVGIATNGTVVISFDSTHDLYGVVIPLEEPNGK